MKSATTPRQPILELSGVSKQFGDFYANKDISFTLRPGEVHCLCGENGAGKSTLMNILYGLLQPTEGDVFIDGKPADIKRPHDAISKGIGMVHQHFMLVPIFTVTENIVLAHEPTQTGMLDMARAQAEVQKLSDDYGLHVDAGAVVENIGVGMQQRVEILKALYRDARILILDEPTAVLTPQEVDDLFAMIRELREQGMSVVLITHKLSEVLAIADRISVLKQGRLVGTVDREGQTEESLARMMVGRDVLLEIEHTEAQPKDVVLEVEKLFVTDDRKLPAVRDVSLTVRSGEIVAIAGIDGNGQNELVDAITRLRDVDDGRISLRGVDVTGYSPHEVSDAGVAHIPQDRHHRAIVLPLSLVDNSMLHDFANPEYVRYGVIDSVRATQRAADLIEKYDVRTSEGTSATAESLSGGNQQKFVIAREMVRKAPLLVAAQPTRGVDIGAIEFIHQQLINERDRGTAILLVSLELQEIMSLADRILVMAEGRIVAEFTGGDVTENELGLAMLSSPSASEVDA